MAKKGPSKNELKGLTYVAQKPSFLANFGKPREPSPPPGSARGGGGRGGREPLPERPSEGDWAAGSDGEKGSDDEWGETFGGGGDDGPQVVVLKEGRHLSADEVKRERRRAAGKPSVSPEPEEKEDAPTTDKPKTQLPPRPQSSSAKRKLVGVSKDGEGEGGSEGSKKDVVGGKKKKKSDKKLLSFDEDE